MAAIGILCLMVMAVGAVIIPSPPPDAPAKYLDVQGCSSRYGFSNRHWLRLVDAGKAPPPTRFGRLVRWKIEDLVAWEDSGCPSLRNMRR
jgi:predicted DNA-binding transcriptional regulator AlpA